MLNEVPGMEIEAKFYLPDPEEFRRRLAASGATAMRGPLLERNWRFDDDRASLTQQGLVLRLRIDDAARLTFKAPSAVAEVRQESEFEVSDPEAARDLLAGLGYHPVWAYEKQRTVYHLASADVMIDVLPFGTFVEVEAGSLEAVEAVARRLGLDWRRRLPASYWALFTRVQEARRLPFRDATFADFIGQPPVRPEELGASDGLTAPPDRYPAGEKDNR